MLSGNTSGLEAGLRPKGNEPVTSSFHPHLQFHCIRGPWPASDDEVRPVTLPAGWVPRYLPAGLFEGFSEQFLGFGLSPEGIGFWRKALVFHELHG